MTSAGLIDALRLPQASRVDQRVPKTLLLEHGVFAASDRKALTTGVEQLQWLAALKPGTIGVPAFANDTREYVEIAVLHLVIRPDAQAARIAELVHRAIPYPVLLLDETPGRVGVSAAHKRWSQAEVGATVVDGSMLRLTWNDGGAPDWQASFLDALGLHRLPSTNLYALYDRWLSILVGAAAAAISGVFRVAAGSDDALWDAVREWERLEADIARLRTAAGRETQMARQVELNLELRRLRDQQDTCRARL